MRRKKYSDLEVRASVYKISGCYALAISSRAIAKKLKKTKVSVIRKGNIFKIIPNVGGRSMWNYKTKDIVRIPITNLLTEKEKESIVKDPLHVKVVFDKKFFFGNLSQYEIATLNPIYEKRDEPTRVLWVNCIFNDKRNKGCTILITRKALYKLARGREIRVLFQLTKDGILLRLTADKRRGRKLYPTRNMRKGYSVEVAFPKKLASYLNRKIGIPLKEFELHFYDFSENEYEKQLMIALENIGIKVYPGTSQTLGDIFFANHNGFIEVTTFKPSTKYDIKLRHSTVPLQVRGRIFEAEHLSIHRNIKPNFIIIRDEWKMNRHILKEIKEVEKYNVFVMFTDFKNNWANAIAEKITWQHNNLASRPSQHGIVNALIVE